MSLMPMDLSLSGLAFALQLIFVRKDILDERVLIIGRGQGITVVPPQLSVYPLNCTFAPLT